MQFIKNGPNIPESLLQLHEEGRVVFFCGAGISYPAGLPGFGDLAKGLYSNLGVSPNETQESALKTHQYDTAIALLEGDHIGGRPAVRHELAKILTPTAFSSKAIATQSALLTLSKNRNGKVRLITTNFDRLFEEAIKNAAVSLDRFKAPLLPVPKNRWDGLVYLHGLLTEKPSESELDCLVIASGDFGLAYLTERWASRFVTELFRHYTVCFVGYSLNDPVLRYMMDALAADRQRGEVPSEMYAFGSYRKGGETSAKAEWRAKNVSPILYPYTKDHRYLHRTIERWAETYRDGVLGKELIVQKEGIANPLIVSRDDDFVGRVLWALSDDTGLPAKQFADLNPVPSLDWLTPLEDRRYAYDDLKRFGVASHAERDDKISFSNLLRPSSYSRAPWMRLFSVGPESCRWDQPMTELARWLLRHLDDPRLVLRLARHGGPLHPDFVWLLERKLEHLAKIESHDDPEQRKRLLLAAPRAIPRPALRKIWRIMLDGLVRSSQHSTDVYRWREHFARDGMTATIRMALRDLLAPCIELREPFGSLEDDDSDELRNIVESELRLRADHVHDGLRDFLALPAKDVLSDLVADFTMLLRDALDLLRELGKANERSDLSYISHPSISEHPQNRDFRDWTALIDLARNAWLAVCRSDARRGRLTAEGWQCVPYPIFKRLALFAAAQGDVIPGELALAWLLDSENRWLWSVETQREAMQLLGVLPSKLDLQGQRRLESAILAGPPRDLYKDDLEDERWAEIAEREKWLLLSKIVTAGHALSDEAATVYAEISDAHADWQLQPDDRDEFPFWMGEGDEWREFSVTPRRRRLLIDWLRQHPNTDTWQEDDWRQRCRDAPSTTAYALLVLSKEGSWPVDRWREALQAWGDEQLLIKSWRFVAPVLVAAPDDVIAAMAPTLSWWIESVSRSFDTHEEHFLELCKRIIGGQYDDDLRAQEPVTTAINHPIGRATEALLRWWYRREPKDNEGLPDVLREEFGRLCDAANVLFRHGRVLLSAHVIALFRVDKEWTIQFLLSFFDWQASAADAKAAWQGFLWAPRLYRPLLEIIKPAFLATASRYGELGDHGRQYAGLLAFAAMEPRETFTAQELKVAVRSLPPDGLIEVVDTFVRAVEGAGEQRAEFWNNRVEPCWRGVWPTAHDYRNPRLSEHIARLCIAADTEFPKATELVRPWLLALEHPHFVLHLLAESKLCRKFAPDALSFLDILIASDAQFLPDRLATCLHEISEADPRLDDDPRMIRLREVSRRLGGP